MSKSQTFMGYTAIETKYFFLVVSMTNVLEWDVAGESCQSNRYLVKLAEALKIELDFVDLHDKYFDSIRVGQGDVFIYKEYRDAINLIAFDFYKEPMDQLDLISISVRCDNEILDKVRENLRAFYDMAEKKICLEESIISGKVLEMIDESDYPKVIKKSNFRQKLWVRTNN